MVSLAMAIASSSVLKVTTPVTGPKISSWKTCARGEGGSAVTLSDVLRR